MTQTLPEELLEEKLKTPRNTKRIDALAYIVGVGGNIAVLPQILKAWSGPAPGLAVLTWLLFSGTGIIWLIYAVMHKQKPLIVAQSVSISCNLAVVAGWMINNWQR